ncbi:hypothetical protein HYH03_009416 [Edaphochlamys debaryana]|uniref:Uncharacterized protein n=1 Tax=Edaphochlamys debaryana TaxID=47281 RepID=A0A835XYC4_9CHLO|nr:hypothetical protein HYH03_009416 [Edaphochlamys debaryana]|eukprot:KAG2492165.1 hypothetical protein HYH03_009416 [Edaphochlamys debaryana]
MVVDSCCSSSGVPAPAAAASKDAASRGGWKHTVVTELRRKCSPGSSSLNKAAAGDEPEAPPLPIPKRLDSTSSTASSATQPLAPASRPRPPCRADFAWVRVIGAGSFGRVSLARHIESGRLVAIKTLNKVAIIRENQVQHVVDERAMLARVAGYPFIINLLTSFQDTDNLYLVMDFVAGGEFFTHLRDHGRLQEEHARFYVAQVVLALEHLHSKGIAYRDLKPENLLIASDGYARLTDLGFAKVVKGRTFTMCGTPDYLAPEVITGKGHTTAVDWWSLGCVIYEMLHGFPPFYTGNPQETYKKILARDLAFPAHMGPWARDLINKLLNPDPALRLGGGVEGVQAVKDHDWFKNLEWNYIAAKAYMPPYTPPLKTPDDTSCFDKYDHLPPLESAAGLTPMQQDWFRSFSVPA